MKSIRMKTLSGMAVVALFAASSAKEAQANHLRELDDLAWRLERTAIRADRDVRYNFRYAPVAKCLRDSFCLIAEKADDLQDAAGRRMDPRLLRDMEECMDEIDARFTMVQDSMAKLEAWVRTCRTTTFRYSRVSYGSCSTPSDFALRRLCGRVEDMKEIVQCMYNELEALIAECGIRDTRRGPRGRIDAIPPVPQQPVLPATPAGRHGGSGIGGPGIGGRGFGSPFGPVGHSVAHQPPLISRRDRQTQFWINFALNALR